VEIVYLSVASVNNSHHPIEKIVDKLLEWVALKLRRSNKN
jgi:hypothetical protein